MASIDFPSSPTDGQTLVANGLTYVYVAASNVWNLLISEVAGPTGPTGASSELVVNQSVTVTANDTPTTLTTFAVATYASADLYVQMKQGTKMTTSKFVVMWDGTDVNLSEYAILDAAAGAANATLTATHSAGTVTVSVSSPDAASTNVVVKATVSYVQA